jgi:hypothetical protein
LVLLLADETLEVFLLRRQKPDPQLAEVIDASVKLVSTSVVLVQPRLDGGSPAVLGPLAEKSRVIAAGLWTIAPRAHSYR